MDASTGAAFGVVTRRATGLTRIFGELRRAIRKNYQLSLHAQDTILLGGFDHVQGFIAGQNQILATLDEIERQANVGIGYAVSSEHVLGDTALPNH